VLDAVGRHDGNAVARRNATGDQTRGRQACGFAELLPGQGPQLPAWTQTIGIGQLIAAELDGVRQHGTQRVTLAELVHIRARP
jgi:hypothetical protein